MYALMPHPVASFPLLVSAWCGLPVSTSCGFMVRTIMRRNDWWRRLSTGRPAALVRNSDVGSTMARHGSAHQRASSASLSGRSAASSSTTPSRLLLSHISRTVFHVSHASSSSSPASSLGARAAPQLPTRTRSQSAVPAAVPVAHTTSLTKCA